MMLAGSRVRKIYNLAVANEVAAIVNTPDYPNLRYAVSFSPSRIYSLFFDPETDTTPFIECAYIEPYAPGYRTRIFGAAMNNSSSIAGNPPSPVSAVNATTPLTIDLVMDPSPWDAVFGNGKISIASGCSDLYPGTSITCQKPNRSAVQALFPWHLGPDLHCNWVRCPRPLATAGETVTFEGKIKAVDRPRAHARNRRRHHAH